MKKISILLTMLLLSVSIGASTGTFTTDDGISYRKEFVDGYPIYEIYKIDNSATTLIIPRLGLESAVVVQFSNEIYGSCPNLTDLYVSTGTTLYTQTGRIPNGIFNGRFANCMPNLKRIHFTGNIWEPGNATFAQDIDVYVKRLYDYDYNSWWGYQSNEDILLAWGNHSQVKNVYCEDEESYLYYKYSRTSSNSASIFGFYSPDAYSIHIPEYITTDNGNIYFNRLGYSGITTTFNCPNDTLLKLGGAFKIDQYSHMEGFPALKKLVFNKYATLTGADFSSNPLTTVEFHGKVTLGTGFKNVATLTKVYFYDEIPSLSGSPGDYFYNNARGITFYMNLDKWQIAKLKETNPLWSGLDIQCIDPSLNYSKVRVVNLGPATFKLEGVLNEKGVTYTIKPNRNNVWYTFDKHSVLYYDYTTLEENSDEMRVNGIVLNDTLNMIYANTHLTRLTASENTLKVSYIMLDIPLGSTWDIQFTKIGDGLVYFSYDNEWNILDPDESTWYDIYDMEHDGEVYNYTFTNYDQDNIIYFSAYCDKPHDGIVHTVRVLANNIPVEPSRIDEDDDDDEIKYSYAISIVGDMDIEIINEDNGRNLSIVNGMGGTIDLCREESTLLSTIDNGTDFTGRYANTAQLYAVIKPDEGKVVNAIYLNDERHSPDEFMEGDSYVVPITGFADGEGTYHMNVVYADKEHMMFDISAVGDGKVDIFMMRPDDGQTVTTLRSATASEALGRHQQVPLYYDEINNDDDDHKTYVEYRVLKPKDGEKVTILWNGNDVTEQFTLTSNGTELRQRLVPSLSETDLGLLQSSTLTAIYEQEESADIIIFEDPKVKAICVANWDTNGDGELSKAEAAAVTTLVDKNTGLQAFRSKKDSIQSFNEFQYFTGLTKVEEYAFYHDSIKSIVLPPNITSIEKYGLAYLRIKDLIIPDGVTSLGEYAISSNYNLENIRLPKNLTTIGNFAFEGSSSLRHIFIPEHVNSIPINTMFIRNDNLASIAVDERNTKYDSRDNCSAIILKNSSGGALVQGCKNTIIPEGVASISAGAFRGMGITKMTIPASVSSIGSTAFTSNTLDTLVMKRTEPITFSRSMINPWASGDFSETQNCVLVVPKGKKQAYIDKGWTENIFKGGIVEEEDTERYDVNRDGTISIADVTKLVNKILGKE